MRCYFAPNKLGEPPQIDPKFLAKAMSVNNYSCVREEFEGEKCHEADSVNLVIQDQTIQS